MLKTRGHRKEEAAPALSRTCLTRGPSLWVGHRRAKHKKENNE